MQIIVGLGNELRGEDSFGIDVLKRLQKSNLTNTKFISTLQLTPELCLELKEAKNIIFIDAAYSLDESYTLSCSLKQKNFSNSISHHLSIEVLLTMLEKLYDKKIEFRIFSMQTKILIKL
ncbi:hydrogenase maturation protease [Halarcobacter anaerophilus]|uniref:hydrogenase maturation protease n=1 Tax=Halarcobacter anaerophilus TaxID=877500 RepID=UPI0006963719|nr:hydrogenase maturation protease [Halarcobacter anaerophilus]